MQDVGDGESLWLTVPGYEEDLEVVVPEGTLPGHEFVVHLPSHGETELFSPAIEALSMKRTAAAAVILGRWRQRVREQIE